MRLTERSVGSVIRKKLDCGKSGKIKKYGNETREEEREYLHGM